MVSGMLGYYIHDPRADVDKHLSKQLHTSVMAIP
jgi:hypothetical protein